MSLLSGTPFSRTLEFEAVSGEENCIPIPAPARGILKRLIVRQTLGAVEGYQFELFDRQTACPGNDSQGSYGPGDDEQDFDAAMHRITAPVTVSGELYQDFTMEDPYQNRDSMVGRTIETFRIYLRLHPEGTGTKRFQLSYTILS